MNIYRGGRKGERPPTAAARTILTGGRGGHCHKRATDPGRLVGKQRSDLTPRHVLEARSETGVVRHPLDRQILQILQILDRDQV
jgi:hypothetical protein